MAQSSLIIKQLPGFGGDFIDSKYLGNSYETGKPYVFENSLMQTFSSTSEVFDGKLLLNTLSNTSNGTIEIDSEIYRWSLQGAEQKSIRILENLESSNTTPGLNLTPFRVKTDLGYVNYPDVVMLEDNEYTAQVLESIPDGTGFILTLKLQTDNPAKFVNPTLLEPGREISRVWASTPSEYNQDFGTQQYPNSFMLEHQVGSFAQKYTVTDKAWRDQGKLSIKFMYSDNGKMKTADKFLPMAEARMWEALYQGMEAQAIYGEKSTSIAKNGYTLRTGAGTRSQMKDGWVKYSSTPTTVNGYKDYLLDIFFSRVSEKDRPVTMVSGTIGSLEFHDALAAIANGFLQVDTHYVTPLPKDGPTPGLAYGYQFKRYYGPVGMTIDVAQTALYDDRTYCKRSHPLYPNRPIDSARKTFMDFAPSASTNGVPNIQLIKVKDTFRWGYHAGSHTPTGPVQGGAVNSLKAGLRIIIAPCLSNKAA